MHHASPVVNHVPTVHKTYTHCVKSAPDGSQRISQLPLLQLLRDPTCFPLFELVASAALLPCRACAGLHVLHAGQHRTAGTQLVCIAPCDSTV